MARIRTIKPEFFTSEDICSMSPLARLFYQACWCEADREGRLEWKPRTMKLRYFPADDCDIEGMAGEVIGRGLVVPYEVSGRGYAVIPSFTKHQNINPRESQSALPAPPENHASSRVSDASLRDSDAQRGRERKGKEGKASASEEASASSARALIDLGNHCLTSMGHDPERFTGNYSAVQTWLNAGFSPDEIRDAVRAVAERPNFKPPHNPMGWLAKVLPEELERRRSAAATDDRAPPLQGWKNPSTAKVYAGFAADGRWLTSMGPEPGTGGCEAPPEIQAAYRAARGGKAA